MRFETGLQSESEIHIQLKWDSMVRGGLKCKRGLKDKSGIGLLLEKYGTPVGKRGNPG